jgi:hypothetical protein
MEKLKKIFRIIIFIGKFKTKICFYAIIIAIISYILEKFKIFFTITPGSAKINFKASNNIKLDYILIDIPKKRVLSLDTNVDLDIDDKKKSKLGKLIIKFLGIFLKKPLLKAMDSIDNQIKNRENLDEENEKKLIEAKDKLKNLIQMM